MFIDCYNCRFMDITGTIKTTIDTANMSYIITEDMNEEITTEVVGSLNERKWANMHEQSRRVYGTDGIAPTIHTCGGGNLEPKIQCGKLCYKRKERKHAELRQGD